MEVILFYWIRRLRAEQKVLSVTGALLCFSGLVHTFIWLIDGSTLDGPVSWRKPILFGYSAGMTVLSIGWVLGLTTRKRGDFFLFAIFAAAMLGEVGLITMQQWRGVASHFNRETPFDATVNAWMSGLIAFAFLVILYLTGRCFGKLMAPRDMQLAIRSGMLLLVIACLIGFGIAAYGDYRVALGKAPETFGQSGIAKFPHGVPIHVIQVLPLLAWALRRLRMGARQRTLVIAAASVSLIALTSFSVLQTVLGKARFDVDPLSTPLLALTFLPFVVVWVLLGFSVRMRSCQGVEDV